VTAVRGPYFDELQVGMAFTAAPAVTLTEGMQAVHGSIVGNRVRLALDAALAERVTGEGPLPSPALVWDVSIGQSTSATQHVKANMFYRGLCFRRLPSIGDTLRTTTVVEALKQNSRRPGRPATGLAALRIVSVDQEDQPVLDYWRCAMLPLSSDDVDTGASDDVSSVGRDASLEELSACAAEWDLDQFREDVPGPHFAELQIGQVWEVEGADVVSSAPELARLTGNVAKVHHDAAAAGGQRLVYGGHSIGLALHQVTRALPNLVTVSGWHRCDHVGPVHEGDALTSSVTVHELHPRPGGGGLVDLHVEVTRESRDAGPARVLDWLLTAVLA
jgi:acyl dehydratase